eukprot:726050_1
MQISSLGSLISPKRFIFCAKLQVRDCLTESEINNGQQKHQAMASTTQPIYEHKLFLCLHCGAGVFAKKLDKRYKEVMKKACKIANIEFKKTQCVRSAVIAATQHLENSELINAGYGSSLTLDQTVENDAGLLNVSEQKWAAMTALSNIINPIQAVEALYLKSKQPLSNGRISPIFLCGSAAQTWCKQNNVPCYETPLPLTSKQRKIFNHCANVIQQTATDKEENNDTNVNVKHSKKRKLSDLNVRSAKRHKLNSCDGINNHGTCGVIGFDTATKQMYVATSSGGIWMKQPGRVGPSALIGSGFDGRKKVCEECDVYIGCCTSGSGEYLMRYRLADECCRHLMDHEMDENVLYNVFHGFKECVSNAKCQRTAGCLVMKVMDNKDGMEVDIHYVHNSDGMGVAFLCNDRIKTCMSRNGKSGNIMISGYHYSTQPDQGAS